MDPGRSLKSLQPSQEGLWIHFTHHPPDDAAHAAVATRGAAHTSGFAKEGLRIGSPQNRSIYTNHLGAWVRTRQ